jgi:hypothetical protein
LARLQHEFRRRDLHPGGRPVTLLRRVVDGQAAGRLCGLRPERIHAASRDEENTAARHRRTCKDGLRQSGGLSGVVIRRDRQFDRAENLRLRRTGTDDEEAAAFGADVELAVRECERRFLDRAEGLRPERTPGLEVVGLEAGAVLDLIDARAIDHR